MFSKIKRFLKAIIEFIKPLEVEDKKCYRGHVLPVEWDECPFCKLEIKDENKNDIVGLLTSLDNRANRNICLKKGKYKLGKRPNSNFIIGKTNNDNVEANLFVDDNEVSISALNGFKVNDKFYTEIKLYEYDILTIDDTRYCLHRFQ